MELLPLLTIFVAGIFLTEIAERLKFSYIAALILAGFILGPFGLSLIEFGDNLSFLANLGLIFLMFNAGSKIDVKTLRESSREIALISGLNSILPFLVGLLIGYIVFQDVRAGLILGIIFISSAIAVIIPVLEQLNLSETKLGRDIIASTIISDITSLTLLAFVLPLSTENPLIVIAALSLTLIFAWFSGEYLTKMMSYFRSVNKQDDAFETELRFLLVFLFLAVIILGILGVNTIIASFLAGILLRKLANKVKIKGKLRTMGYGLFIPIFFLAVGLQTDISLLLDIPTLLIALLIVFGLLISKVVSGTLAGVLTGFTFKQSLFLGVATTPQLTTTLAVTFAAAQTLLLPQSGVVSVVLLTIITSVFSTVLMKKIGAGLSRYNAQTRRSEEPHAYVSE